MSKETVMIEVPVEWAEDRVRFGGGCYDVNSACQKALAGRKTKYEKWREGLHLDYSNAYFRRSIEKGTLRPGPHDSMLMAAAPKLLDALVNIYRRAKSYQMTNQVEAIRAALPEDVANEVLK